MKILFVSMSYEHINDMHINNILSFQELAEVDFYGPGYRPDDVLAQGLECYWKDNGGYDAVILDFALALLQSETLDAREAFHWHRYALSGYNIHTAIRYADEIIGTLKKLAAVKAVLYWYDTFTFQERWERILDGLLAADFYFWGPGMEYFPEVRDQEYLKKAGASNRYRDFCRKHRERIISMCHATINYIDHCMTPLEEREYDITIPGNLDRFHYPERARIEDILKTSKYRLFDQYHSRTMGYLDSGSGAYYVYRRAEDKLIDRKLKSSCVYMDWQQSKEAVVMWRENYKYALRSSKMGYACGAVSRQILRKFAEIPCSGALLLCEKIPPFANYGFVDGVNAVTVTAGNVLDVCGYYLTHMSEMQKIADNGRKMILEKHTALAHNRLVIRALEAVRENRFHGSCWENGQFVME